MTPRLIEYTFIRNLACIITGCLLSINTFSQIRQVQQPKFENPNGAGYYFNSDIKKPNSSASGNLQAYNTPKGANADDIIRQQNRGQMPSLGGSIDPDENQRKNQAYIAEQMRNDPAYGYPNANNNFSPVPAKSKEFTNLLNEIRNESSGRKIYNPDYFKTPEFTQGTKSFTDALQQLKNMGAGNTPISLRAAYYRMESAYGNTYLSYNEYKNIIKESADFIKNWLAQNGYNPNDQEALHLGIQHFLSDTLSITIQKPDSKEISVKTHLPFSYDYDDFKGERDHKNYFITKGLATGSGQCNSLPEIYIALSEALGAKAYLSLAPLHSFIKYPDNSGNIKGYEPTSNHKVNDKWYQDNMGITERAKSSKIYLDTLNKKQILADCILQLAMGYIKKHGTADGKFIMECINAAQELNPNRPMIYGNFLLSMAYLTRMDELLYRNNIKDLKDIAKAPEAEQLYKAYIENEETIKKLGYQEMPPELYEQLMGQMSDKGLKQSETNFSTKQKRNLFIISKSQ